MIRIVYIEDNPQNLRLIKRMLSNTGYEVFEAQTGKDGLALIEQERPDLILLDINLPDIEGTEVAMAVKADPALRHIPVIALTANAMHGDREHFMKMGCEGYIAKPVSRTELNQTIELFVNANHHIEDEKEEL
jgi:two-component system, cell cycle response regulator DivK